MTPRILTIEYRPVASLQSDPQNPRLHSKRQVRQIARSIEVFGFVVPVLIDGHSQVIAGHGRVLAARLLGMAQVPTICLNHLTEAQIQAFMIADNKLTENAVWDERLLAEQFKALSVLELDFSVDVTGFEVGEIDVMIEGLAPANCGKNDPADAIPESRGKPQITQLGDIWNLDRHRICCGDARDDAAYSVLMQGRRAAAVFADAPYNDPIDRYVTNFGKIRHPEFAMASGEMDKAQFTAFLTEAFTLMVRVSQDGSLHYVCMDWRHIPELLAAARQTYTEFKNLCVWVKNVAGQGSLYRSQHELVFLFKNGRAPHGNNIELGRYGRYRTNVWQYNRVNAPGGSITDEGNLAELHPTVKPVQLVADAILDCTGRGNVVLDPFLGSGTTVIAAERTDRVCYGIELNPSYVDVIVRRWQSFTGQNAVHQSTSRTFHEIEEEVNGRAK